MHTPVGERSDSPLEVDSSDASHSRGHLAIRETVNRIVVTESQLITLLGLVREYSTDKELYTVLAEARP